MKLLLLSSLPATSVAAPVKSKPMCLDPARCPRHQAIALPERGSDYFTKMSLSLVGEGGLLSEQAVHIRLSRKGISNELSTWLDEGTLRCIPWGGQRWVPMFQLTEHGALREDVQALADELAGAMDDLEVLAWFVCPNEALNRKTPLAGLRSSFDEVLEAARMDHFLAAG